MKCEFNKEQTFETAVKLIYTEGIETFSTNKVIKEAGVSKGGFTYYFPSKKSFLTELCDYLTDYFIELLSVEEKAHQTITDSFIDWSIHVVNDPKRKVYVALGLYHSEYNWKNIYEIMRQKLLKENSLERTMLLLLMADGIWHSGYLYSEKELQHSLLYLKNNI